MHQYISKTILLLVLTFIPVESLHAGNGVPPGPGVCGNGTIEYPEKCDKGAENGTYKSVCTADCRTALLEAAWYDEFPKFRLHDFRFKLKAREICKVDQVFNNECSGDQCAQAIKQCLTGVDFAFKLLLAGRCSYTPEIVCHTSGCTRADEDGQYHPEDYHYVDRYTCTEEVWDNEFNAIMVDNLVNNVDAHCPSIVGGLRPFRAIDAFKELSR